MVKVTKRELEEENEKLRSKLEEAHEIISQALGYEDEDEGEEEEQEDEAEEDKD